MTLTDAGGTPVRMIGAGAGVTVPKQQLNASNYRHTRITYQWARPAAAAMYQLRFAMGGASRSVPLDVPAP